MKSLLLRRPLAYFIDFVIIWCVCLLPQLIAYYLFDGIPFKYFSKGIQLYFWVMVSVSLPIWLYFILTEKSARQATIGKRIMKLKVTDIFGNRINLKQSFLRTFIKLLPWELTHIGLIPIYFSTNPQIGIGIHLANLLIFIYILFFVIKNGNKAVHDFVAGTSVVNAFEVVR